MLDRPESGERAILVQLALPGIEVESAMTEFEELAESAQASIVDRVIGSRHKPDAKYFIGLGKAEELCELVAAHKAELVLVNHELSPSQERNLERLLSCRVVGRSGLILDIFAQRARTFEGKLQVELAQLQHLSTRLVRGWTHLERQKGGIGLRGPGETQLETDRRLLRNRLQFINKRLEKVRTTRAQNRAARRKADLPTVSLVGYTNAGKSTLFNALTGEAIFAADQLFATLDPLMRKIEITGSLPIILADTVGFIRDLPHALIDAFRATLEETTQADLLLHVIDASDPKREEHQAVVEEVLQEIGAGNIPVIQVLNKIDNLPLVSPIMEEIDISSADSDDEKKMIRVWLSAKTGVGIEHLREAITQHFLGASHEETLVLTASQAKLRAMLYAWGVVVKESIDEQGSWLLSVRFTQEQRARFESAQVTSS
mgnify:CR=1 FL=1